MQGTTSPGLFVGWRLESGLRHRGVLYIADYDTIRAKGFGARCVRSVPEKECHFPERLIFPFAIARKLSIENMQPLGAPAEAEPPPPMLFEEQGGVEESVEISNQISNAVPGAPRFRITSKRMIEYGMSPGCHACETFTNTGHTSECRERFRRLLTESGELKGLAGSLEGDAPPNFLQPSAESVSVQVREDARQMESLFG